MKCKKCGGKGYIESWYAGAASWTPSISQCQLRCNLTGYSDEVQHRLNDPNRVTAHLVIGAKNPDEPILIPRNKFQVETGDLLVTHAEYEALKRWGRFYGEASGVLQIRGQKLDTPINLDSMKE